MIAGNDRNHVSCRLANCRVSITTWLMISSRATPFLRACRIVLYPIAASDCGPNAHRSSNLETSVSQPCANILDTRFAIRSCSISRGHLSQIHCAGGSGLTSNDACQSGRLEEIGLPVISQTSKARIIRFVSFGDILRERVHFSQFLMHCLCA